MLLHAVWRSLLLIGLGVFLRSNHRQQTHFTFEDVLSQIGLGYTFLFLLWGRTTRLQIVAAVAILVGTWLAFVLYPLPPPGFDSTTVGVPADWPHLEGLAAHFDKNVNVGTAFDRWFLNLFPRAEPFTHNGGGYQTLNFVPSLATMIFGLLAGELLRSGRTEVGKVGLLVAGSAIGFAAGLALDFLGLCPIVKRIWTPSWALFSTGWTCLLLAAFYASIDLTGWKRWAFPLVVVGMNSIAFYCLRHLTGGWIEHCFKVHLGPDVFKCFGDTYAPIVEPAVVLAVLWLIALWMHRRRIFLRI
jgi:predicted acyltransferase